MIPEKRNPGRAVQARTGAGFSSADSALDDTTSPTDAKAAIADEGGWQVVILRGSAPLELLAQCDSDDEARELAAAEGGVAVFRGPVPFLNAAPPPRDDF
jgi:hypothetical protein